jgi:hypothetical protein
MTRLFTSAGRRNGLVRQLSDMAASAGKVNFPENSLDSDFSRHHSGTVYFIDLPASPQFFLSHSLAVKKKKHLCVPRMAA